MLRLIAEMKAVEDLLHHASNRSFPTTIFNNSFFKK
jgi:hypothetical protein